MNNLTAFPGLPGRFHGGSIDHHPMLQHPTATHIAPHHRPARLLHPRGDPGEPEPDLSHLFWNHEQNRPNTLYDIYPHTSFTLPSLSHAYALKRQAHERLLIYSQLERACKDERARAHPAWWRTWVASWACCCGCGGAEVGLGYSTKREGWKEVLRKAWEVVHDTVWGVGFLEVFMYVRAVWVVAKMGAQTIGWGSLARWM